MRHDRDRLAGLGQLVESRLAEQTLHQEDEEAGQRGRTDGDEFVRDALGKDVVGYATLWGRLEMAGYRY